MKAESKHYLRLAVIFTAIALLYTLAVKTVNVQAIGPDGTSVGFAGINAAVARLCPYNSFWYNLTDAFGIVAIGICGVFGCVGAYQWFVTRKKLLKVDWTILMLGCLYIVTIALYVFFLKFALNYRPVIMPGEASPEASFPSSHTMLICVVITAALIILPEYIRNQKLLKLLDVMGIILLALTVAGRILSGAHWITDIIGGIIYSLALIYWFMTVKTGGKPRE